MKSLVRRFLASLFERQVRRLIRRHRLTVVAVAGSVGKTSTKSAIATVLKQKFRVLVHPGNYNSELGLPLSIFELSVPKNLANPLAWAQKLLQTERRLRRYPYQVLVLELGTDHPGEIAHYLTYLKPDIGVITAITPEHMENFPNGLDDVAAEEMTLAPASKTLILNDDAVPARYQTQYARSHPHVIRYGSQTSVHWAAGRLHLGDETMSVKPQVIGAHSLPALLGAAAVAGVLELSQRQIVAGLQKVRPVSGRMNPLPGLRGSTIIDDTYNSSPDAALAALTTLMSVPAAGRRIAIMGSMNELGAESPRYHAEVGAAAAGVDLLVTIGLLAAEHLGPAAVRAGLSPSNFHPATSPKNAAEFVKRRLGDGDLILAKGSQNGVFAEEAVKLLLRDPADAKQLVRQSPAWLKIKAQQFPDIRP